jgi:hypothetical protein
LIHVRRVSRVASATTVKTATVAVAITHNAVPRHGSHPAVEPTNNHSNAAHGITNIMPRSGLCRAVAGLVLSRHLVAAGTASAWPTWRRSRRRATRRRRSTTSGEQSCRSFDGVRDARIAITVRQHYADPGKFNGYA